MCILKEPVESTTHGTVGPLLALGLRLPTIQLPPASQQEQHYPRRPPNQPLVLASIPGTPRAVGGHRNQNQHACRSDTPVSSQNPTSTLQAVVEEAGVSLCWEGVEGQVLGLCSSKLHVGPILILVVLQGLVCAVQGADIRFS